MKGSYIVFIASILYCGVLHSATVGQRKKANWGHSNIVYISPMPGSKYLTPSTNIIVRADKNLNASTIQNSLFNVVGSLSGEHDGKVILSNDQQTVLFNPNAQFVLGETVSVSMRYPLLSINGDTALLDPFSFAIASTNLNADKALISRIGYGIQEIQVTPEQNKSPRNQTASISEKMQTKIRTDGFPADLPPLTVTASDSPTSGYIFLATNMNEPFYQRYGNYLMIVDNTGNPVFYRNIGDERGWDFKIQPTDVLTYFHTSVYPDGMHYVMNTSLQVIDSITCGNNYPNDGHELAILQNGNIFLLGDDYEQVDMSKIVPGGDPYAAVIGNVIQELDKNKNVIFQWRTFDHFNITDAIGQNLDSTVIDPVHANAIEIDPDGNILLSSRHLSEITKIDVETGDIIWRLGGNNNQFNFVNDPIGFSYQHDIRRLPDGDITLMDNGNMHNPPFSRAVEYKLDEVNLTATLVWQFRHNPDVFDSFMGNVQRLENGNTLIGWGGAPTPTVTEVRPDGSVALEMSFPEDSVLSYRAFRFPFLFITSPTANDTLQAGATSTAKWNSSGVDTVDIDYSTDGGNSWASAATNYPADNDSINLSVPATAGSPFKFRIIESGALDKGVVFISDPIAVSGSLSGIPSTNHYSYFLANNYPNPFNPSTTIEYEVPSNSFVTLRVYDVLGREVETLVNETKGPGEYSVKFDGDKFPSGVYFYRMSAGNYTSIKKALLIK